MSSISLSASIFMTVSVTVERYWAVCKPAVFNLQLASFILCPLRHPHSSLDLRPHIVFFDTLCKHCVIPLQQQMLTL